MPHETKTGYSAPYVGRAYFVGRRRLVPRVPVDGRRVYVTWSLWRGYVVTDSDGVEVFRTRRPFIVAGGWLHA